ncbi:YiiD C-terminal domain-containing protein [Halomonas sp. Bachu 37]|uniref:YiiD C-terminal domain-containing protein n=1 Tax=Halomonas kashgarensis TaxID=3084920 RepID=UPI0032165775
MTDTTRQPGEPYPRLPLPASGSREDLSAFHAWLANAIPMVTSLGIEKMQREGDRLEWQLALAPNLNDKGTGFGGALAAQTTLQGWCWVTLWLREHGLARDVVVAQASQRFLAPVKGDYRLVCTPRQTNGTEQLHENLQQRGKGRIQLVHQLYCGESLCLEAEGDYAVLPAT